MTTATTAALPERVKMALRVLLYGPQQGARTYRTDGVNGLIYFKLPWMTDDRQYGAIVGPVMRYGTFKRDGKRKMSELRIRRMNEYLANLPEPTPEDTAWANGYSEATRYSASAAL